MTFKDIYCRMDYNLLKNNYHGLDINEKKELIEKELKNYILEKFKELNIYHLIPSLTDKTIEEVTIEELVEILNYVVEREYPLVDITPIIHLIINIASNLQEYSIEWYIENDKGLIEKPRLKFADNSKWLSVITHKDTNYSKVFNLVYDTFKNNFLNKDRKKQYKLNK